jgi:hypothetical protein
MPTPRSHRHRQHQHLSVNASCPTLFVMTALVFVVLTTVNVDSSFGP